MDFIECTSQAEVDAVKPGDVAVVRSGFYAAYDSATVTAYDSATVRAYDSATVRAYGSATVTAYDSATVTAYDSATVRAYGSATVRAYGSATVTAYGSATVTAYDSATVRAYDSATVTAYDSATVTAYGSAAVRAYGSATVRASKMVPVHKFGNGPKITGGVILNVPDLVECDAATWLDYYGVKVTRGTVVLYKAVSDTHQTGRGERWTYKPGAKLTPERWNPARYCGDGLHLCARPFLSARYQHGATKYVAVKVKVADIVPLGDKVKVAALTVLHEVDIDGNKVVSA